MNQLPDVWRTEVLHPMFVHLPLVLLLLATVCWAVSFFLPEPHRYNWRYTSRICLYAGALSTWLGVYTGELAHSVVTRQLCDPTVLKEHENTAITFSWLFTIAAVLDLLFFLNFLKKYKRLKDVVLLLLMLIGTGFLVYSGHLGASLVYQQAAGVYRPSENCVEFE